MRKIGVTIVINYMPLETTYACNPARHLAYKVDGAPNDTSGDSWYLTNNRPNGLP